MSKFFINRPIFAWVIAIVLMVAVRACNSVAAHRAQYRPPSRRLPLRSMSPIPAASGKTLEDNRHAGSSSKR